MKFKLAFMALFALLLVQPSWAQDAVNVLPDICSPGDQVILAAKKGTAIARGSLPGTYTCDALQTTSPTFPWVWNLPAASLSAGNRLTGPSLLTTPNGAVWTRDQLSELITLSTSGATTDSSANLLPAGALIKAVTCRVTTTITTATAWSVGDGTTAARFIAADSTMTAGETQVGLAQFSGVVSTAATGPTQAAAAKLRITTTGTPAAGKVRCTVFFEQFTAPTS